MALRHQDSRKSPADTTVGSIRHNVYAHVGDISTAEIHERHKNGPRTDYERLSMFPLDLYNTLFQHDRFGE
jgi:hypothetical protein